MKTLGEIEKQYREYEPIIESKTKEELEALIEVVIGDIAENTKKLNEEENKKIKKDGVFKNILPFLFENSIYDKKSDINDELLYAMGYPLFLWNLVFNSGYINEKTHYSNRSISTVDKVQKSKM